MLNLESAYLLTIAYNAAWMILFVLFREKLPVYRSTLSRITLLSMCPLAFASVLVQELDQLPVEILFPWLVLLFTLITVWYYLGFVKFPAL